MKQVVVLDLKLFTRMRRLIAQNTKCCGVACHWCKRPRRAKEVMEQITVPSSYQVVEVPDET